MEKKIMRMHDVMFVLAIIEIIAMNYSKYLACWIGLLFMWVGVVRWSVRTYLEWKNTYPDNKTYSPIILKKMFWWIYESEKLPKCFLIQAYLMMGLLDIYTILFLLLEITNSTISSLYLSFSYIILSVMLILYVEFDVFKDFFLQRFKIINKYNIRYLFPITYNSTSKWPISNSMGKCKIINTYKKGKKIYASIKMHENEMIYENVLLASGLKEGNKNSYKLYEICYVKYIT